MQTPMHSRVDPYGFEKDEDFDHETYDEVMSLYLPVLARRSSRWHSIYGEVTNITKSPRVKRFCRKGIPAEWRPVLWVHLSGAAECMRREPDLYRSLLNDSNKDTLVLDSIEMDLHRTFPENIYFCDSADPSCLRQPLKRVLIAIAHKNSRSGYCQGQNFVAGILLLIVKDEEQVFWIMDCLINQILPVFPLAGGLLILPVTVTYFIVFTRSSSFPWSILCMSDYYCPDMTDIKADQELLGELVKWKCPLVAEHLSHHGVSWMLVATKWFICAFADVLPMETVLRLWDCLFYEGVKVIYRAALTLVIVNQDAILAAPSFSDIVTTFKATISARQAIDCHRFIADMFKLPGSFPHAKITKMREICVQNENVGDKS